MLDVLAYISESRKDVALGVSLLILYITYYLVEAVKRPVLVCREGAFREFLERRVPLLGARYWPTPWCVEARLQTVLGSLLRSHLLPRLSCSREVVPLEDGGQVALDWVEGGGARALLLVVPGLAGGAGADYARVVCAAGALLDARCAVLVYRGLGGLALSSPRLYCALSHADLGAAVLAARERVPGVPVLAVGVSLGGLILGHYLAEAGAASLVDAALIVSSPLDVERGSRCMERGLLNALLSRHMARVLVRTVRAQGLRGAEWSAARGARSVRQFDEAFTAPHFGFPSAAAYYRAATLRPRLALIRVPLLCLCAADDPFQPLDALPTREALQSDVALAVTARGGHIGFLEGAWPAGAAHSQYLARLTAQYFGALLSDMLAPPRTPA